MITVSDTICLNVADRPVAGSVRMRFDFARDGWVIEQPRVYIVDPSPDETDPEPELLEDWAEVAFFPAWSRQQPGDLPWQDDPADALSDSD